MGKRENLLKFLLVAVLAGGLIGCGGQDETPPAGHSTQTEALVPGSVAQSEEPEMVEAAAEVPGDVVEPPAEALAIPEPAQQAVVPEEVKTPDPADHATTVPPAQATQGLGIFSLQLGSYTLASQAEEKAAQLRDLGFPGTVEEAEVNGRTYHRVFIRGLEDHSSAEKLGEDLHTRLGLSYLIRRK